MTGEAPGPASRKGGWPGPRKPQWSFRPTPAAEDAVAGYIEECDLDPERDRSRAINTLLELASRSSNLETPPQDRDTWETPSARNWRLDPTGGDPDVQ